MPTYDYLCNSCDHQFETFQSMKDDLLMDCPECGESSLRRLIGTGAGIIFKGSGFYETDYKNNSDNPTKSSQPEKKPGDVKKDSTSGKKSSKSDNSSNKSGGAGKSDAVSS